MFEQYKQYAADLSNIGARYAATNTFYMSVLAAVTGLLAYTDANKPLHSIGGTAGVLLPAFAAVACLVWWRSITAYRHIFAAKFAVLRLMEAKLEFDPYTRESDILRDKERLTGVDQAIPVLLALAYGSIAVFFAVGAR